MLRNPLKFVFQKRALSRTGRTVEDFLKWKEQNRVKQSITSLGDIPKKASMKTDSPQTFESLATSLKDQKINPDFVKKMTKVTGRKVA